MAQGIDINSLMQQVQQAQQQMPEMAAPPQEQGQ
jgi:hypothetical protein